jgi:microcystin-dependent protein
MAEPFLGEIRMMSFNFPPKGWAFCNGQFLPINQNQALFSLLGTQFGGNGQTTFALPNLRGQAPIHMGGGFTIGQAGGQSAHTITMSEMAQHFHFAQGSSAAASGNQAPPGAALLATSGNNVYAEPQNFLSCAPAQIDNFGGSQAHTNMMPYLVISFAIALVGIFPSQN